MTNKVHRFSHEAMTTEFEAVIVGHDEKYSKQIANAAWNEIDRLQNMLTRFDPCSEIGQINLMKPGESRVTSQEVMDCLLTALWVHSETSGAFDVTVGSIMNCWRAKEEGYVQGHGPAEEEIARARYCSGIEKLVLDPEACVVGIASGEGSSSIELDLGGIGKGYALDKAAEVIEEREVQNFILHGGASTILAIGKDITSDQKGWNVGLGEVLGHSVEHDDLVLSGQALSRSGTESKGDHVLNPATGCPVECGHKAAWAVSPSAAVADALSTAFMVMTADEVSKFCQKHKDVDAYLVPRKKRTVFSKPRKTSENMHFVKTR